jgi:hypothetical protein
MAVLKRYIRNYIDAADVASVKSNRIPPNCVNMWFQHDDETLYVMNSDGVAIPIGGGGGALETIFLASIDVATIESPVISVPCPIELDSSTNQFVNFSFSVVDLIRTGVDAFVNLAIVGYHFPDDPGVPFIENGVGGSSVLYCSPADTVTSLVRFNVTSTAQPVFMSPSPLPAPNGLTDIELHWDTTSGSGFFPGGILNLWVTIARNQIPINI